MQLKRNLVRIATFSYLYYFISRVLGFVLITLAFYRTGKNFLGLLIFTLAFIGYFKHILDSFRQSLTKDLAKHIAQNNLVQLKSVLKGSFAIMLATGLVLGCGVLLFDFFAISSFFDNPEFVAQLQVAFIFVAGYVVIAALTVPFQALQAARQRNEIVHIFDSLQLVINTSIGILILIAYPSMALITLVFFLAQLLALFIYFILERDVFISLLQPAVGWPAWVILKEQLRFTFYLFLFSVAMIVLFQIDVMLIAYFLPTALIALYGVCQKIYSLPMDLSMGITSGLLPATSYLSDKKDNRAIKELFFMGTKYSMIIYFAVGLPLFIYAFPLLKVWFGQEFAEGGVVVLRILLVHQWFNINHCVGGYMLKGIGKVKELLTYAWLSAIFNLILSLILIQKFKLIGIAIGTSVPFIVFEFYILKSILRHFNVTWKEYLSKITLPIYLPMLSVLVLSVPMIKLMQLNIWQALVGLALTSALLFTIYILRLSEKERSPISNFIMVKLLRKQS